MLRQTQTDRDTDTDRQRQTQAHAPTSSDRLRIFFFASQKKNSPPIIPPTDTDTQADMGVQTHTDTYTCSRREICRHQQRLIDVSNADVGTPMCIHTDLEEGGTPMCIHTDLDVGT
jgi:hypothetical protein